MDNLNKQYQELEKADLHVHLNGLFNTDLIKKIIADEETIIPSGFDLEKDLNILFHKGSLNRYLKPWNVLRLMPIKNENLEILIDKAFADLSRENIRIAELRSSILYLSLLQKKPLEEILLTILAMAAKSSIKHNIKFGLIFTIPRGNDSLIHLKRLISSYINIGKPQVIIGLDLAGNEDISISDEVSCLFRQSKIKYGLKITIHAGETGNVNNVLKAINDFDADRIGHGTAIGMSPKTMDIICKKDICIEVCPISNRRSGAVRYEDAHPVKSFIKNNVPFVICSDNPGIHKASLTEDYIEFLKETNKPEILQNMLLMQKRYSFIK